MAPAIGLIRASRQRWQFFSTRDRMRAWLFCQDSLKGAQKTCALTMTPKTLYIQVMFATLVGSTTVPPCGNLVVAFNVILRSQVAKTQVVLLLALQPTSVGNWTYFQNTL